MTNNIYYDVIYASAPYGLLKIIEDRFNNDGIINFGKIAILTSDIESTSIQKFIETLGSNLNNYELIETTNSNVLFKSSVLIFNATWKIIENCYIISFIVGTSFEMNEKGVCVYCEEQDDGDTVVALDDDVDRWSFTNSDDYDEDRWWVDEDYAIIS